jgi:hypothetical protein
LGIFHAVDLRRQEALRQLQEREAFLARAEAARDQILKGDLSGLTAQDLPAIVAGLTPEEIGSSLWLIMAQVALAQREEHMRNMVEYLFNHPCNTYCLGLRKKFSSHAIRIMIIDYGEEAEEKIAFLPPERGSRYWNRISRNSWAYSWAQAEAEAAAKAQAQARPRNT